MSYGEAGAAGVVACLLVFLVVSLSRKADRQQQALLSGNATAARASTLQGAALLRVAEALLAAMPAEDDGAPDSMARSMILTIFAALVSESDPPNTVKSCAKA